MEMLFFIISKIIYVLFGISFLIITVSFLNRIYILYLYKKTAGLKEPAPSVEFPELPFITVQLPIYNDSAVVLRLVNNICQLDYPRDRLEIQVLDDSTDETREMAQELCRQKKAEGIDIAHIHRENREGYKAGAMHHALEIAKGEFIAIFDSDFLPAPDFLRKTIHFFTDKKIGWVQASWAHLNENFSLLTQCIALFCDSMFKVESSARNKLGHWGVFNGTAGVLRKAMINHVGGWQWDTITEDNDLSYRAQALGWQYVVLTETSCLCELPPTLPVFIEQQSRWSKGNVQVIRKLFKGILSANVGIKNKFDFITYLTNYLFFPAVTFLSLLIMPNILLNGPTNFWGIDVVAGASGLLLGLLVFLSGIAVIFLFFKYAQNKTKSFFYLFYRSLLFIFMSIGLAPFIAVAILEGFFKKDHVFVRTPKFDLTDNSAFQKVKNQASNRIKKIALVGFLMGLYMLLSLFVTLSHHTEIALRYLIAMTFFFTSYSYFGLLLAFPEQKLLRNIFEFQTKKIINTFEQSTGMSEWKQ